MYSKWPKEDDWITIESSDLRARDWTFEFQNHIGANVKLKLDGEAHHFRGKIVNLDKEAKTITLKGFFRTKTFMLKDLSSAIIYY